MADSALNKLWMIISVRNRSLFITLNIDIMSNKVAIHNAERFIESMKMLMNKAFEPGTSITVKYDIDSDSGGCTADIEGDTHVTDHEILTKMIQTAVDMWAKFHTIAIMIDPSNKKPVTIKLKKTEDSIVVYNSIVDDDKVDEMIKGL